MNILRFFTDEAHYIEFCSKENLKKQFVQEALEVWDKMEGTLPHLDIFVEAFANARWRTWQEGHKWN